MRRFWSVSLLVLSLSLAACAGQKPPSTPDQQSSQYQQIGPLPNINVRDAGVINAMHTRISLEPQSGFPPPAASAQVTSDDDGARSP